MVENVLLCMIVTLCAYLCHRVTIARDVGAYRDMALIMAARSRYGSEQEGLTA